MPTSFKRPITVSLKVKTPENQLEFCSECGGLNAMGRVAVKIDCTACDTTGYSNYYTTYHIPAYYIPGGVKRWDAVRGGVVYQGESAIKLDSSYKSLLNSTEYIEFNNVKWNFSSISDPGASFGQERSVLALTRKA